MTGISAGRVLAATGLSLSVVLSLAACGGRPAEAGQGTDGVVRPGAPGPDAPDPSYLVRPEPLDLTRPTPPTSARPGQERTASPGASPGSPASGCPASGVRLTADEGDAAMGLRAHSVTLTNCGTGVRRLNGYPEVWLLGEGGDRLRITVDRGARRITTGVDDPGPKALTIEPGRSARFRLVWRNTYDDTSRSPVVGTTLVVTPAPGEEGVRVTPAAPYDLGTTDRLGITAWEPVAG